MFLIWLGALCIVGGLLLLAIPPIWGGRLSGRQSRAAVIADGMSGASAAWRRLWA